VIYDDAGGVNHPRLEFPYFIVWLSIFFQIKGYRYYIDSMFKW